MLALGAYGVISVASHLVGNQIKDMIEKFLGGDTAEAAAIHRHLLGLISALFIVSNPIPVKHVLNHLGFRVGKPRLPLIQPDEQSASRIISAVNSYSIDLPM
jgi:4-hydroxy-tetrahydrodipicolinate synthase